MSIAISFPIAGVQTVALSDPCTFNGTNSSSTTVNGASVTRGSEAVTPDSTNFGVGTWTATFSGLKTNDPMTLIVTGTDSPNGSKVEATQQFSFNM